MASDAIDVQLVLAMPDHQQVIELTVVKGTCVREVALQSVQRGLLSISADIDIATIPLGIFGECVEDNYVVSANERIELYRPLQQDPKELRRQRADKANQ